MSMGPLWGALAPQGYNLYPIASLSRYGESHVSTKFSLGATTRQSWPQCIVYGIFSADFSPRVRSS
ncbi:hypothetical protein M9458_057725, partial [Cirrhinus mrigala]